MQIAGQSSWIFVDDAPTDLNFSMYVAGSLGILPKDPMFSSRGLWPEAAPVIGSQESFQRLGHQWHDWWLAMVAEKSRNVESEPRGGERWSALFAPTDQFRSLDDPLRTWCAKLFEPFQRWWSFPGGGSFAVQYWTHLIPIYEIVQKVAKDLGRPVSPFHLTAHFVYAGLEDILDLSPGYVILGINKPSVAIHNRDWWIAKIRSLA